MQRRNFAGFTVLFALLAVAAWAVDVTGAWTGTMSGNGDFTLTYTFKQDGDKLSGTVLGPQGETMPLINCKIEGDQIAFAVKVDLGGNPATFSSTGIVKGDEMTITTTNDAGMDFGGQMTLKKQAK
jgi:hypothetical protein